MAHKNWDIATTIYSVNVFNKGWDITKEYDEYGDIEIRKANRKKYHNASWNDEAPTDFYVALENHQFNLTAAHDNGFSIDLDVFKTKHPKIGNNFSPNNYFSDNSTTDEKEEVHLRVKYKKRI